MNSAKRILILEDDQLTVKLYKTLLKDYGVDAVANIIDAMELAENNDYDCYIVDIHIKNSRYFGTDFINAIREPHKVIITTTLDIDYFLNTQYQHIKKLRKPVKNEEFIQSVKQIVEGFKE